MCCHPNEISLFCAAAAFVPSGREAIKLCGSAGSPARHNTCGRNEELKKKKKTGFGRRPNLCLRRLWRSQPRRAAGRVAVEQISSNLNALVQGLRWEGCSPVPPHLPTPSPSNLHHHHLLLPVPALRPQCQQDTRAEAAGAVGWRVLLSRPPLCPGERA